MEIRRLTGRARERMPEPLRRTIRSVLRLFGWLTADMRMKPSFVIIGAQRSGTTTLYRLLSDHPQVVRPSWSKGIGFFDLNYHRGKRWYLGHFPFRWNRAAGSVTFESSGYYSFHPSAAVRMAKELPDVRVVLMVRDPVERAYSAYKHEFARGYETASFEEALGLEEQRLDGEVERIIADPRYESFHHRHHAYVRRGRYSEQIDRFRSALGEDSVYVMDADRFFASPVEEFMALTRWLDLDDWTPAKVEQWNARPGAELDESLRQSLSHAFEPYDDRLTELLGRRPSWRS